MARHDALEKDEEGADVPEFPKEPGKVMHSKYISNLLLIHYRLQKVLSLRCVLLLLVSEFVALLLLARKMAP
jgi:hypothetical protein